MFYRPHARVTLDCGSEMITKQSHKDECDINRILSQYKKTGIITHITNNQPLYTDLPSDLDYQSSLNTLFQAENAFASLPSVVRAHFNNDPAAFLAAFSDPSQRDKLTEFGLIKPPAAAPTPAVVPVSAPPAPTQPGT